MAKWRKKTNTKQNNQIGIIYTDYGYCDGVAQGGYVLPTMGLGGFMELNDCYRFGHQNKKTRGAMKHLVYEAETAIKTLYNNVQNVDSIVYLMTDNHNLVACYNIIMDGKMYKNKIYRKVCEKLLECLDFYNQYNKTFILKWVKAHTSDDEELVNISYAKLANRLADLYTKIQVSEEQQITQLLLERSTNIQIEDLYDIPDDKTAHFHDDWGTITI